MIPERSYATELVDELIAAFGPKHAAVALDAILDQFQVVDLAALAFDWRHFWARPKQIPPASTWRSFGFLAARGLGKTRAIASHIVEEVQAGRATCIGLAAQNEEKTIDAQVGGLLEASPPWFYPLWISTAKTLTWPNGAVAYAHTPEVPGAIRSHNFDLAWLSEIQSWPVSTRREAYLNFKFATRIGYARTVWDATPKKRHPMLKALLERSAAEPERHIVVRGTIYENARNLAAGVIEDLEAEFGGTSQGREELLGEMLTDSDSALVKQEWIDAHRRNMPDVLTRRVVSVDPAVTTRGGSDRTGIIDAGLGTDGQVYVCGDHSGKRTPSEWANIVLDVYVRNACELVIVETNKGGDLVTQNLRAAASKRGLAITVVGKDERPHRQPGTVFVKEVHARGPKEDRAQPLATAYERGRVSHVIGVNLAELEDTITTWEPQPGQRSPDALDAEVHAVVELLGLLDNKPDPRVAMAGITSASRELMATPRPVMNLGQLFRGMGGGGGRI